MKKIPLSEIEERMRRFRTIMDKSVPDWQMAFIISKVNQYYFTGTMQDGMLIIPRDSEAILWVRRSYERAMDESLFPRIMPMESYRNASSFHTHFPHTLHMEMEVIPLALNQRLQKYFPFEQVKPIDSQIAMLRAVKSPYELSIMERAGEIHRHVLEDRIPEVMKAGMSEAELATCLYSIMVEEGHQGLSRFGMFDTEMVIGHICFGESSLYPTYFNGPGGNYGLCPASPFLGNRERKLADGDLVFIDIAFGLDGYHTDKTMTYMFGKPLPSDVVDIHKQCVEIQNELAHGLKPGMIPAVLYEKIMKGLSDKFLENFMGYGKRIVRFLGHGIGLTVDELPVIANGFTEPLQEGMVFALEPKKGIPGIGMVGIENTFIVTPAGGQCITGKHEGLMPVQSLRT